MDDVNFLYDKTTLALPFYKSSEAIYTYQNLLDDAHHTALLLKSSPNSFFALKMESPYKTFVHLLAGSFVKKDMVLLSSKEPEQAILSYQKNLPFTKIVTDIEIGKATFDHPVYDIDRSRPFFYIMSSGSSGPSKGIPLTLNNVYASAKSVIDVFQMDQNDTTFLNLPHHHIGGLMILFRAFFSRGSVTTIESSSYEFVSLVPLQLKRFLSDASKIEKLQKCRGILIGGAPLSEEIKIKAHEEKLKIFETYGMTETSSLVLLNGRPLKGQEVKLDSAGHFLIKGATLSLGVKLDEEGFYHTKDVGIKNPDASFSFKYRSDVLFKSAGEMINPLYIEDLLKSLPWITQAVVVPIKHPEWTLASCLVYTTDDSSKTPEDIKSFLKNEVHPYLVPKYLFKANSEILSAGIKPKRFNISEWAQAQYFKNIFHHLFIPAENAKKLIVYFHGFMEDCTDMIPLMDNHQNVSYLFIDLPGHGKTLVDNTKLREAIFDQLSSLINFYQKDLELILYGYSMGGRVALEIALTTKPNLLILESAHFGLGTVTEKNNRYDADLKLFSPLDLTLKDFFTKWYTNPIFGKYNQSSHYKLDVEKKLGHSTNEWQTSLEYFSPGSSPYVLTEMLELMKEQKIVAISGSEDEKYSSHYQDIKKYLPNFTSYEIDQAGHNPHKTHLSEIKKILRQFI